MPPASPACLQAAPTPVFVDDTGRRHRLVRLIGWVIGGLTLAYLTLLGISLVASPGLIPLSLPAIGRVLPGPSAPQIADATEVTHSPGELLPGDPRVTSLVPPVSTGNGGAVPLATTTPHPTRSPATPRPTATPSATRAPQGNPSPAGTPRASRTPTAHPSPKSTHASPHDVKGTPMPSPT